MKISLRAARINSNLTIKKVAGEIGISEEVLRNYERGRTVIPESVIDKLATLYEVKIENLKL